MEKIQIYQVIKTQEPRLTPAVFERIKEYYNFNVTVVKCDELKDIVERKVHLLIFDAIKPKDIQYSVIDKIQHHNKHLYTAIVAQNLSEKDRTEVYENHIDHIIDAHFDDKYLVSKMKTILKRMSPKYHIATFYEYKNVKVDRLLGEILINGQIVDTTRKEFKIIKELVKNHDHFMTKHELFQKVWNYDDEDENRILDQYLHRIKRKIGADLEWIIDRTRGIKLD